MKLIAILLLGISIDYNADYIVSDNSVGVQENLNIVIPQEVIKNTSQTEYLKMIEDIYFDDINISAYNVKTMNNGDNVTINFNKNYENPYVYANNTVFTNQLFSKITIADYDSRQFNVTYPSDFFEQNKNSLTNNASEYTISMNLPVLVTASNASRVENNKYIWNVNSNSSSINAKFDINEESNVVVAKPNSVWDSFPIKLNFTSITLILIIGGIIISAMYIFFLHGKNNTI